MYVNCWSYQNKIIRIDTTTDKVDASLEVGVQPKEMVMDRNKNLWVVTDGGGWEQNPAGFETPAIVKVNTSSFTIDKKFELTMYANVGSIAINGEGDRIYYTCNDIYSMSINDNAHPAEPIIEADPENAYRYYGLGVDPTTGLVYVADAKDFTQNGGGKVYDNNGNLKKKFDTGICPDSSAGITKNDKARSVAADSVHLILSSRLGTGKLLSCAAYRWPHAARPI